MDQNFGIILSKLLMCDILGFSCSHEMYENSNYSVLFTVRISDISILVLIYSQSNTDSSTSYMQFVYDTR